MANVSKNLIYGNDWSCIFLSFDHIVFDFDGTLADTDLRKELILISTVRKLIGKIEIGTIFNLTREELYENLVELGIQVPDKSLFMSVIEKRMKKFYGKIKINNVVKKMIKNNSQKMTIVTAGRVPEILSCLEANGISGLAIYESKLDKSKELLRLAKMYGHIAYVGNTQSDRSSAERVNVSYYNVIMKGY